MKRALGVVVLVGFMFAPSCGDDACSKRRDKVAEAATVYEYAGYDSMTAISLAEAEVPNPGGC